MLQYFQQQKVTGWVRNMKILCYGDSNTWGYDPRSYFGSRYPQPWPELLAEETGWQVCNQGENGRVIPKSPEFFPEDVDLLILMLGTNDLLQSAGAETAAARMERFLRTISMEGRRILLVAPPPLTLGAWVPDTGLVEESRSFRLKLRDLSQALGTRFADAGDWNIPLAYDGVHFTQEGHRAFAKGLYNYLNKGE